MKKICMIVPDKMVKGGIASVVNGYRGSWFENQYQITYIESYKDGSKLAKLLKGVQCYFRLLHQIARNKPDIVHVHSSFGLSFFRKIPVIYIAWFAGVPIINHIHGAEFDKFFTNASNNKKKLIKKVYGKCDKLIALSEEWKKSLSKIVQPEKIVVIENYSVLHEDAFLERQARKNNHMVLFLGEIGKRKGCYDIPDVVQRVAKDVPDVKFVLCGVGTPNDEQAVAELCRQKNISDKVLFPGWVRGEEKDRMLRDADVFFLPSYNEGMPMSVLDAMGYGLPIVSTQVGGIPKIVHDFENGMCVNAGDIEAYSNAIVALLKDDMQSKRNGEKSMEIVRERYSLDIHLRLLSRVYDSIK